MIIEWIELRLNNEKHLFKFCEYLLTNIFKPKDTINDKNLNFISSVLYQHLWSLHNKNPSAQFIIDQTLRRIVTFPITVSKDELFSFTLPENIHPLILSIIVAVCGGIYFTNEKDISKINFSQNKMHRHSSILIPINDYFSNQNETHSIKIQILIKQYENVLKNTSQLDTSVDIVDTFVALICLQGLSQPSIYQKYEGYQALSFALKKFKQIWFYLKTSLDCASQRHSTIDESLNILKAESIIHEFISQSDEQCLAFSLSCAAAWKKLNLDSTLDWFKFDIFHKKNLDQYLECQPEFSHSVIQRKIKQMTENIHPLQIFQHEPFFLLTFVPQSLQPLYYYMINNPINNTDSSLMVILLSHCLIFLNKIDTYNANFYLAVLLLLPKFKQHMLENYALVLFEEKKYVQCPNENCTEFFKAMKDRIFIDQPKKWEILIDVERQRINEAKNIIQNHEKDLRFFAASICLARLFQKQYLSYDYRTTKGFKLSASESEEVHFAIINILNPVIRIIALSIVLNMKDPFIFYEEQKDQLTMEMIDLLNSSLPNLSLSMSTLLFIRCYMICQNFPLCFQHMIHVIGEKFNKHFLNEQTEEQETVNPSPY